MRALISAALAIVFAWALPALASAAPPSVAAHDRVMLAPVRPIDDGADRQSIQGVITAQIDAFRRDDADAAWALAAPGIHAMFGTPSVFLDMVRNAYQAVYRPRQVTFATLALAGDQATQAVDLIGPDGAGKTALYKLTRQPDGHWLIDGCSLVVSGKDEA